jgi:hypothetical protein
MAERRREVDSGFGWENLREIEHMENPGVDGRMILRWNLKKWDVGAWIGSVRLRIGTDDRQL